MEGKKKVERMRKEAEREREEKSDKTIDLKEKEGVRKAKKRV